MKFVAFDEMEPHVIGSIVLSALGGGLVGALPGAILIYLPNWSPELIPLTLVGGAGVGAIVGALAASTALLIAALRGRRHRYSSASRRYQHETTAQKE